MKPLVGHPRRSRGVAYNHPLHEHLIFLTTIEESGQDDHGKEPRLMSAFHLTQEV